MLKIRTFIWLFAVLFFTSVNLSYSQPTSKSPTTLLIKQHKIKVNGKEVFIYRIEQPNGTWGYTGLKDDYFNVLLKNNVKVPTSVHWHGLVVPNDQDGVPYISQLPIPPGGSHPYYFKLKQSGTYWMHSHFEFQVQQMLSAPLIIKDPKDPTENLQQVILFLNDFSFKNPQTILYELKRAGAHHMHMNMDMKNMPPDLNDVKYDAFLTNYRTLENPDIISIAPGKKIRLRIIDASAATNFFINLGNLKGKLISIDGNPIVPISGSLFSLAVGQRLDIIVDIPATKNSVYPILANVEGTKYQTGLILNVDAKKIPPLRSLGDRTYGAVDYSQELKTKSLHSLPQRSVDQTLTLNLNGNMLDYTWSINNQMWPDVTPLKISPGKRIEIIFNNLSDMAHPMHLHGHVFQVVEIAGKPLSNGPMHDTILVLPHSSVKVQFDSDNSGNWMLHCHMLYHQESGMMSLMNYDGVKLPNFKAHSVSFHQP